MKFGRKEKVLTVFAFIFLFLAVLSFVFSSAIFASFADVVKTGGGTLGDAVAASILVLIFLISALAFLMFDVAGIIFGGVMIKLSEKRWRTFFIVDVSATAAMLAAVAAMFLILII